MIRKYLFVHPKSGELLEMGYMEDAIKAINAEPKVISIDGSSIGLADKKNSVFSLRSAIGEYGYGLFTWHKSIGESRFANIFLENGNCYNDLRNPSHWESKHHWEFGVELEFFLFKRDKNKHATNDNYGRCAQNMGALECIADMMHTKGIPVNGFHAEVGQNQYEISLQYCDPLVAADRALLAENSIGRMASFLELATDFSPKPFPVLNGNGRHLHISCKEDIDYEKLANRLCAKYDKMVDILAPSNASHKRLVEGFEAPTEGKCGIGDRTAAVRIIEEDGGRIEIRVGDNMVRPHIAFPYLITLLEGCLDG